MQKDMSNNVQPTAAALGLGTDASLPEERRVTAENWRTPPYNRHALQRIQLAQEERHKLEEEVGSGKYPCLAGDSVWFFDFVCTCRRKRKTAI